MKAKLYDKKGKQVGEIDLPIQFAEPERRDLIRRAFLAIMSHRYQPQGVDPMAGKRKVVELSKRRRRFRSIYGRGVSRTPRKVMYRLGASFGWVGAFVPFARGGRTAHPPKVEKKVYEKINKKERKKAIRSALAAAKLYIVKDLDSISKPKDVLSLLSSLKIDFLVEKAKKKKVRAGKGTMRGRRYKQSKGPLFVASSRDKDIIRAARNIPGSDVVDVKNLNVELLAPGGNPGRYVLISDRAIEIINNERLFA